MTTTQQVNSLITGVIIVAYAVALLVVRYYTDGAWFWIFTGFALVAAAMLTWETWRD